MFKLQMAQMPWEVHIFWAPSSIAKVVKVSRSTRVSGRSEYVCSLMRFSKANYKRKTQANVAKPLWCHQDVCLAGGLEHDFYFSIQLGMSSSQLTNVVSLFFGG